jgi:hypothetical protein
MSSSQTKSNTAKRPNERTSVLELSKVDFLTPY